jgi:hypothetical protein
MKMTTTTKIHWADKMGAISALFCVMHCLAVPSLLALGIGFINNPIIAFLFILLAFFSVYNATKKKRFETISIILWVAFVGFVTCILFEERAVFFEYGMFFFSSVLILAHLYNIRSCLKP